MSKRYRVQFDITEEELEHIEYYVKVKKFRNRSILARRALFTLWIGISQQSLVAVQRVRLRAFWEVVNDNKIYNIRNSCSDNYFCVFSLV